MKSPPTYAYYPGCTLKTTAIEFDVSTKAICSALGIRLLELKDWGCCGASSAHSTDHLLGLALPAREIASASRMGWPLMAVCAMCFSRLKHSEAALHDPQLRKKLSDIIGSPLPESYEVVHLIQVIDGMRDRIPATHPLKGLKVACYYGCVLVRPKDVTRMDDVENPQIMDRVLRAVGASTVDWSFKTECCGAGMALPHPDIMMRLSYRILSQAKQAGADCIATACPLCFSNLDSYQKQMMKKGFGNNPEMPVFYFTELIGLAIGLSPERLLIKKHMTDAMSLLKARKLTGGLARA
ncbi:MAG: CoB--CoM heterodisulfide reductase iron-sulfur subunit B family protein [Dehalococcoidia bacterium]|nr:CoB--CoM heterodisulfide reductase iron-sulfur subunit B family protein [Dehalococcoidia bacterium]